MCRWLCPSLCVCVSTATVSTSVLLHCDTHPAPTLQHPCPVLATAVAATNQRCLQSQRVHSVASVHGQCEDVSHGLGVHVFGVDELRRVLSQLWRRFTDAHSHRDVRLQQLWSGCDDAAVQHAGVRVAGCKPDMSKTSLSAGLFFVPQKRKCTGIRNID